MKRLIFDKGRGLEAVTWLSSLIPALDEGKSYSVEVKQHKKRRSLDANAYCWVLIGKLAEKTQIPKREIYRHAIREIGGNSETVCVMDKAADRLCEGWEHNGEGWQTQRCKSKIEGCTNVTLYYGSSVYDTAQMSRLIDNIVADCRAVGIETMTPAELNSLKEAWK